jgi:hypothetical protein
MLRSEDPDVPTANNLKQPSLPAERLAVQPPLHPQA